MQYVGQTTRQLNKRMSEHRNTTDKTAGIMSHHHCSRCTFDDLVVMVIEAYEYEGPRPIAEMDPPLWTGVRESG